MDNRHAAGLASARQLIEGSREMVATSIARLIATNSIVTAAETGQTGRAFAATAILLTLLDAPCDLDVLVFAHRHTRVPLTVEDIPRAVGHDAEAVRVSIETLMVAGLIACTKSRRLDHDIGVLFYEFTPRTWDGILAALCWVAASPDGRRALRKALLRMKSPSGAVASELQTHCPV